MKVPRVIRYLYRDIVDLLMWLVTIGMLVTHFVTGKDVSGFLWILIFYVFYAMFRLGTFWETRKIFYDRLKELGENPEKLLTKKK